MIIKLTPQESYPPKQLAVWKNGEQFNINGLTVDLTHLEDGATLPAAAIDSPWLAAPIERVGGELILTLFLPNGPDSTEAERFPVDLLSVPNGRVALPGKLSDENFPTLGFAQIDWASMVTAQEKALAAAEQLRLDVTEEVAQLRAVADTAIAPLQDAVDLDLANDDEAAMLKEWKRYRVALNRLPDQAGYPTEIDWPAPPA